MKSKNDFNKRSRSRSRSTKNPKASKKIIKKIKTKAWLIASCKGTSFAD